MECHVRFVGRGTSVRQHYKFCSHPYAVNPTRSLVHDTLKQKEEEGKVMDLFRGTLSATTNLVVWLH